MNFNLHLEVLLGLQDMGIKMTKKIFIFGLVLLFGIFLIGFSSAAISHCCEKRTDGAWCVDSSAGECATTGCGEDGTQTCLMEPTACISTSYCALGTCVDKDSGDCIRNTPQSRCDIGPRSFWDVRDPSEIPQCQVGCCSIGDQASFVTQTKCKNFATLYSIETHFQLNIQDEISCIATATPDAKGACVFERDFDTTCRMITKSECQEIEASTFHRDFLCTAEDLATNCAPTKKTTCVEEKDEVFFLDSCGNLANVYNSGLYENKQYWTKISEPNCDVKFSDVASENTAGTCGNCNYFNGSTCKTYNRIEDGTPSPTYGDNICRDLNCEFEFNGQSGIQSEEKFLHGETWCANSSGTTFLNVTGGDLIRTGIDGTYSLDTNLPGSRYFRMVCYNGEVTVEPCADRRAEVCVQSKREISGSSAITRQYRSAICRANAWQDCYVQDSTTCEDSTVRDCQLIKNGIYENGTIRYTCVPLVSPGFDFWVNGSGASDICGLATTTCTAKYSRKLDIGGDWKGDWEQESGKECFGGGESRNYKSSWGTDQKQRCAALGDCQGTFSEHDTFTKIQNYLRVLT